MSAVKDLLWEITNGIEDGLKELTPARNMEMIAARLGYKVDSEMLKKFRDIERIKMPLNCSNASSRPPISGV